jgi:hypothetical protein
MQVIVLLTLLSASVCEFIATLSPSLIYVKFVPEVLSIVITVMVVLEGLRRGFRLVAVKYWVAFGLALFIIVCGALTNSSGPGPIVAGMRSYLRAIPLFLVPAVFQFSDKQLATQIKLILFIGLLQAPVACYQRYIVWAAGRFSGDSVQGTATESGILSTFLVCVAVVLLGYFMRKQISKVVFFPLFFALLLPTMINETKATVLLLPVGLLTTVVAGSPRGMRVKVFSLGVTLLLVFGAIMVPVYDYFASKNPYKDQQHLMDFFTNEKTLGNYIQADKQKTGIGSTKQVRRGDAIRVPLEYLVQDPVKMAFGLGLGNASHSNLGQQFVGTYFDLFQAFAYISFSIFLLEIGILGTILVFILYAFVFFDAVAVARTDSNGTTSSLAVGWIGVVTVMSAATFYSAIHVYPILSYLYWYVAGIVAARRCQLALASSPTASMRTLRRSAA